jgi:hypothetical protein
MFDQLDRAHQLLMQHSQVGHTPRSHLSWSGSTELADLFFFVAFVIRNGIYTSRLVGV